MLTKLHQNRRYWTPWMIALFVFATIWAPVAGAGLITTEAAADQHLVQETRAELHRLLAEDEVRERLVAWGVDPEQAAQRVDRMTDAEVREMAARMEEMPAGGVVGALLIVFLVLLFTDIMGWTDVFPFVRKTAR